MKTFDTLWVFIVCAVVIFLFSRNYREETYTGELCFKEVGSEIREECTWFIVTQDKIVVQEAETQWEEKILEYEMSFSYIRILTESGKWTFLTNGNLIQRAVNQPSIGADLVWSSGSMKSI